MINNYIQLELELYKNIVLFSSQSFPSGDGGGGVGGGGEGGGGIAKLDQGYFIYFLGI